MGARHGLRVDGEDMRPLRRLWCFLVGHDDKIIDRYIICLRCDDMTKRGWFL